MTNRCGKFNWQFHLAQLLQKSLNSFKKKRGKIRRGTENSALAKLTCWVVVGDVATSSGQWQLTSCRFKWYNLGPIAAILNSAYVNSCHEKKLFIKRSSTNQPGYITGKMYNNKKEQYNNANIIKINRITITVLKCHCITLYSKQHSVPPVPTSRPP